MADIIRHKRSGDTGEIPTTGELVLGELAVNYYDGRLFIETYDGTTYGIAQFQPMADGDKGDITVSAKGQTWTIDNDAVTYAKIQNVSATDRLLGRSTAGAGDIEEITCTAAGRAILDDADATAQRTTLGLGTLATANYPSITNASNFITTDVALATLGTYFDIASVSLVAGTWYVFAQVQVNKTGGTNAVYAMRISDGTTNYSSAENEVPNASGDRIHMTCAAIVVLAATTTIKVEAMANNTAASIVADTIYSLEDKCSGIIAMRLS